ncbi:ribosomal S11 (chloroplast), partial [Olea europaea subsp. europaea]
ARGQRPGSSHCLGAYGFISIVTVTDVRGRVVSWSSAGTCGFKGAKRGTPFAAQTAAANAIRTVVDQCSYS